MQLSDGPARNLPAFWLGDPSSGWRWPFEATFTAWKVWALSIPPAAALLFFATPKGALLAGATWSFARYVRRTARPVVLRGRNVSGRIAGTALALLGLSVVPSPGFWLLPFPWYAAAALAPAVALLTTRVVMRHVTPNTPLAYWRALLPKVARGPRPSRPARQLVAAPSAMVAMTPVSDIELAALSLDPREVKMPTARPRVREVEYSQWLPANIDGAARTVAWAATRRLGPVVNGDRLVVRDGRALQVLPGQYVVVDLGAPVGQRLAVMPPSVFARDYETTA